MPTIKYTAAAGTLLAALLTGSALGAVHEPFNGAGPIAGQNQGQGFAEPWALSNANGVAAIEALGLQYPGLVTEGGALRVAPVTDTPEVHIERRVSQALGAPGTTFWVSYLIQADDVGAGHVFVGLGANGFLTTGKRWGNELAINNEGAGLALNEGIPRLVVARYEVSATSGPDQVTLWIDPDLSAEPQEAEAHAIQDGYTFMSTDLLRLNVQGYGQGSYLLDELRVGETFAEVTPLNPSEPPLPPVDTAYEPFATAGPVAGQAGGEGLVGAWALASANGSAEVVAGGLSYPGLATAGGALNIAPTTNSPAVVLRRVLHEAVGHEGDVFWSSYLLEAEDVGVGHAFLKLGGNSFHEVGKRWGNELAIDNTGSGITLSSDETHLLVTRYEVGANGAPAEARLWIDPPLGAEPALATASAVQTGYTFLTTDLLELNVQGYGQGRYLIDELRVAPTFEGVTPAEAAAPPVPPLGDPRIEGLFGSDESDSVYNIRPTADGGYLISGSTNGEDEDGDESDFALIKLRADFTVDTAFADDGIFTIGGDGQDTAVDAIQVFAPNGQPDGYFAVGQVEEADDDLDDEPSHDGFEILLVRLTQDGDLYDGFHNSGVNGVRLIGGDEDDELVVHLDNYNESGFRIARKGQNFIVAGMTRSDDGNLDDIHTFGKADGRDIIVFEIDDEGRIVNDFGDEGFLKVGAQDNPQDDRANDFAFGIDEVWLNGQLDGFVVSGYTEGRILKENGQILAVPGNIAADTGDVDRKQRFAFDHMLLRVNNDGSLRSGWGAPFEGSTQGSGIMTVGGSGQEKGYDVQVDIDGSIYVSGRTSSADLDMTGNPNTTLVFAGYIAKLDASGQLDPTFHNNGVWIHEVTPGYDSRAQRVQIIDGDTLAVLMLNLGDDIIVNDDETFASLHLVDTQVGEFAQPVVINGSQEDIALGLIQNAEGRLVVAGMTQSTDGTFLGLPRPGGFFDAFVLSVSPF